MTIRSFVLPLKYLSTPNKPNKTKKTDTANTRTTPLRVAFLAFFLSPEPRAFDVTAFIPVANPVNKDVCRCCIINAKETAEIADSSILDTYIPSTKVYTA